MDLMQPTAPEENPSEQTEVAQEVVVCAPDLAAAPPAADFPAQAAARRRNEQLIRRIRWIAAVGFAAFFAVIWLLLRTVSPAAISGRDPLQVVRAEISALGRGDLQTAYAQLSKHYRDSVPFNTYHMLVISHRRVFLTRKYSVSQPERRGGEMFVVAELESETGARYTANFTLVRDAGRWWIDDLHWQIANHEIVRT
jgi:hypothetical protein